MPFLLKNGALLSFSGAFVSKMVPRFYSEVWSQVSTDLTREGWAQSQSQGLLSTGDKFKMGDPVEGLRNLVVREIESICCSLRSPTTVSNVQKRLRPLIKLFMVLIVWIL